MGVSGGGSVSGGVFQAARARRVEMGSSGSTGGI